jgi:catechol 2,3-dioxygenase-like lactoylglutathione lyase family enzyme
MTGRWHGLVIDTPDPRGLATFYQEILGFVRVQDEDHWVVIGDAADRPGLAFQLAPDLQPPGWPGNGPPQQMHLDIAVDDIEQAEEQALSLGAVRLAGGGGSFRVYRDPSGHPFCLCF